MPSFDSKILRPTLISILAIAASGCALLKSTDSTEPRRYASHAVDASYDLNLAMEVAGVAVPFGVESFYFLVLDDTLAPAEDVAETRRLLQRASEEDDYLGITGPQAHRNVAVVRAALEAAGPDEFDGATLIFLGPSEQVENLRAPALRSGAQLRFMIYPPARQPAPVNDAGPL